MVGREIDVDVGRALVVLVQESLEEQVVRNRIDTRDPEQIGDDRVRCSRAATARVMGWYLCCTASWQSR